MFKNVASQKVTLLVIDTATNLPKTGDAANLTFYVSKDDGSVTALGDTSATEIDSTNALGLYTCDLTQAETNGDKLLFTGKSSTSGVRVVPLLVYAVPAAFTSLVIANGCVDADVERFAGTAGTFSSGRPEVNTTHVGGTSQTARDIGASVLLSSGTGTGQISLTSGKPAATIAAGDIATDAITAASVAAAAVTKIQNGLATPTNITAGTITTVTNLTNAPTSGDLTATMKTSVTTAATAATPTVTLADGAITAAKIASDAITAAKIATDAITAAKIATDAVTEIQSGLSTLTQANIRTAVGLGSANLDTQLVGVASLGTALVHTAGKLWVLNEDGNPVASASAVAALPTDADVNAQCDQALADYDPPTRTEATADKDAILAVIATVDTNVDAILVDTGTTIPDLIDDIDTGGGSGGGSVEIVTEKVAVGEHYVETGGSLAAFKFDTHQIVEGERVLHTYSDMTLALYIDGTLSGTVPVATELSEGKFQFAASPVLPTITAGQRLRIAASSDDGNIDDEDVWFGIVAAESSLAQVVFTSFEDANTGGANVTWFTNETAKTKTVQCENANGDPIDLDTDYDLTDAYLVIERAGPPRIDVQVIDIADITIGGADDNELTFQADATVLLRPGDFIWAFRQADKSVIATGRITVSYAADITP